VFEHEFEDPIYVIVGLGSVKPISTVMDAYVFLNEWPMGLGKPERAIALKACKAALSGLVDAEMARSTFEAFAQRNYLLVPNVNPALAARVRRGSTGAPGQS
jgi:hypothetical protein